MNKKLEKIIKAERQEEREIARKAAESRDKELARSLHADGIDEERIAKYTKSTVEQVRHGFVDESLPDSDRVFLSLFCCVE